MRGAAGRSPRAGPLPRPTPSRRRCVVGRTRRPPPAGWRRKQRRKRTADVHRRRRHHHPHCPPPRPMTLQLRWRLPSRADRAAQPATQTAPCGRRWRGHPSRRWRFRSRLLGNPLREALRERPYHLGGRQLRSRRRLPRPTCPVVAASAEERAGRARRTSAPPARRPPAATPSLVTRAVTAHGAAMRQRPQNVRWQSWRRVGPGCASCAEHPLLLPPSRRSGG